MKAASRSSTATPIPPGKTRARAFLFGHGVSDTAFELGDLHLREAEGPAPSHGDGWELPRRHNSSIIDTSLGRSSSDGTTCPARLPQTPKNGPAMRDLVYLSYSHRDKKFHKELREILDRDVRIKELLWDDTKIHKGANVAEEIAAHVARAKIMVMLVSPNYLAPNCSAWDCEIKPAMQARERGELIVLWIPVGAVCASDTPFPDIMPAGDVSRPLGSLRRTERQKALEAVRAEIVRLIGEERSGQYDAFLSHNSKDKPVVRQIADALKDRGLNVWLDEWVLPPGQPWQPELEQIIRTTKAAIILVGPEGMGPWEEPEMRVCLDEFVKRRLPVIPVLLPDVEGEPELPLFLRQFTWVDLREGLSEQGFERLVWGVTGRGPGSDAPRAETREAPRENKRRREALEPVVRLSPKQMLGLFVFLALFSAGAFWIHPYVSFVFIALTVAVGLFGFLGAFAQVENKWGKFGGSAGVFVATLLILLSFGDRPKASDIVGMVLVDGQPVTQAEVYLLESQQADNHRTIGPGQEGRFEFRGVADVHETVRLRIDVAAPVDLRSTVVTEDLSKQPFLRINLKVADLGEEPSVPDVYRPSDAEVAAVSEILELRGEVKPGGSARVQVLDLSPCRVNDQQLRKWLSAIDTSEVETLDLSEATISNAVLPDIAALRQLKELYLTRCRGIDAAGLRQLAGMTSLESLALNLGHFDEAGEPQRGVVDAGLIHLQGLSALQILDLSFTDAGDSQRGLSCLSDLKQLLKLNLARTPIDDEDLQLLSGCPQLATLDLTATAITDKGLAVIGQVRSLQELSLQQTKITKQGLDSLKGLTLLRSLTLLQTEVKPGDEQLLRQELKNKTGREIEIRL